VVLHVGFAKKYEKSPQLLTVFSTNPNLHLIQITIQKQKSKPKFCDFTEKKNLRGDRVKNEFSTKFLLIISAVSCMI